MKVLGWDTKQLTQPLQRALMQRLPEAKANQFEDVLKRIIAARDGDLASGVTPDNCMRSPTVHAIVTAVTRRFAVTPLHVYQRGEKNGRETKEKLPNHPISKLLAYPNNFQTRVNYWQDAVSWVLRNGCFYAYKSQGGTGPIRALIPMAPNGVEIKMNPDTWDVSYLWSPQGGVRQEYPSKKVHHVRGPARNGVSGDSPVEDVKVSIGLEIAAEKFGTSFFQNGALPLMIFKYMVGSKGFKNLEDEKRFIDDFQTAFGSGGDSDRRHRALLLPIGVEHGDPIKIENDKAQMIESRRYQRTVIAGAWGVPPHLVGDLERATFNNVEQQDQDFTSNVIMPYAQMFEAAMERDLLTDADFNNGVIIRFNLDSILRADFKTRQEGLKTQRDGGAICVNEWREMEGKNPISEEDGGEQFLRPANFVPAMSPVVQPGGSGFGGGGTGGGEPPPNKPPTPPSKQIADAAAAKFIAGLRELASEVKERNHPGQPMPTIIVNVTIPPAPPATQEIHNHMPSVDVAMTSPNLYLTMGETNVKAGDVVLERQSITMMPAPVTVNQNPATMTFNPAAVTVHPPTVTVNNLMEKGAPAIVNVAPAHVLNVQPDVYVNNKFDSPVIHVAPADVRVAPADVYVENKVEASRAPIVNIENRVEASRAPEVRVENKFDIPLTPAPNVTIDYKVEAAKAPDVFVENKFEIPVSAPIVNIDNKVEASRAPDVFVENTFETPAGPVVNIAPAVVNFDPPDVKVETHVDAPVVHIAPAAVNIEPTVVNVAPTEVKITNSTPAPNVHVDAPSITVLPPEVKVTNEVKSPIVNVEAPEVHVSNRVETPIVNVQAPNVTIEPAQVEVKAPNVTIGAPDVTVNIPPPDATVVNVAAPNVTVKNELPEYETVETEAVRDKEGRLKKTITRKKRK